MKKLVKLFLGVSLASTLMLTACGNQSSTSSTKSASGKKIVIHVGTWESGQAASFQKKIAQAYMKSHPNVEVDIESVPDNYGTKILTQIAGGNAPDIFQIGDGDVSTFQSKGAILNLSPFIKGKNGLDTNNYYPQLLNIGRINGNYYTLPKDYSTIAVYYNKDLFDKAGISYPSNDWTWKDFENIAKKLTIKSGSKYKQWGASFMGDVRWNLPLIYSYGGDVISPDGKTVQGYMNSKGTVQALTLLNQMINIDKISPSTQDQAALQGADLFQTGKVAMAIGGIWPLQNYIDSKMNFGIAYMPKGPNGQFSAIGYSGYGIYSKTKNKKAAWDYLKYMETTGQSTFAQYAMSAYKPAAKASGQTTDKYKSVFVKSVSMCKQIPEVLNPNFSKTAEAQFLTVLQDIEQNTFKDKPNISSLLDNAAKKGQSQMENPNQ